MVKYARVLIIVSFIIVTGLFACMALSAQAAAAGNLGIYYGSHYVPNSIGEKVGWHLMELPRARNCPVTWHSNNPALVDGFFPPGLKLDGFKIVGTPTAPGKWFVKLKFQGIVCQGRSYPDEIIDVNFNIYIPEKPTPSNQEN